MYRKDCHVKDVILTKVCAVSPQEANKEEFELSSMRCGRKLTKEGDVSRMLAYTKHIFLINTFPVIVTVIFPFFSTAGVGQVLTLVLTCL